MFIFQNVYRIVFLFQYKVHDCKEFTEIIVSMTSEYLYENILLTLYPCEHYDPYKVWIGHLTIEDCRPERKYI